MIPTDPADPLKKLTFPPTPSRTITRFATVCAFAVERLIGEIGLSYLDVYFQSWKLAGITAEKKVGRLRGFFNFCVERDWIEKNPAKLLKAPRHVQTPTEPVSDEDFDKLIEACDGRERVRAFLPLNRKQ